MSPQTFVLATTLIGAVALGADPDEVVDDVPVVDGELHEANIKLAAAITPTATTIRGCKRVVMGAPRLNENGNRFLFDYRALAWVCAPPPLC